MEQSINGAVNGHPAALIRTAMQQAGVNRVIYTLSNGQYVGTIHFDGMSADLLRAMAQDFHAFINEQTGGVALAPAAALSQLPKLKTQ